MVKKVMIEMVDNDKKSSFCLIIAILLHVFNMKFTDHKTKKQFFNRFEPFICVENWQRHK